MGPYQYQDLYPLIGYFPCHWVVLVDFPQYMSYEDSKNLQI